MVTEMEKKYDLLYSLSPCLHISRVLGLLPYSTVTEGETRRIAKSKLWLTFSILLFIIVVVFSQVIAIAICYLISNARNENAIQLTQAVNLVNLILVLMTGALQFLCSMKQTSKYILTCDIIIKFDLKWRTDEGINSAVFKRGLLLLISLILLVSFANGLAIACFLNEGTLLLIIICVMPYYEKIIAINYATFCYVIHHRFADMEAQLSKYLGDDDEVLTTWRFLIVGGNNAKSNEDLQRWSFVNRLEEVRKCYDILADAVDSLNSTFGPCLFISVAHILWEIVSIMFCTMVSVTPLQGLDIASRLLLVLVEVVTLFVLTVPCVSITDKVSAYFIE